MADENVPAFEMGQLVQEDMAKLARVSLSQRLAGQQQPGPQESPERGRADPIDCDHAHIGPNADQSFAVVQQGQNPGVDDRPPTTNDASQTDAVGHDASAQRASPGQPDQWQGNGCGFQTALAGRFHAAPRTSPVCRPQPSHSGCGL